MLCKLCFCWRFGVVIWCLEFSVGMLDFVIGPRHISSFISLFIGKKEDFDSVQWQKHLYQQKIPNSKATTHECHQNWQNHVKIQPFVHIWIRRTVLYIEFKEIINVMDFRIQIYGSFGTKATFCLFSIIPCDRTFLKPIKPNKAFDICAYSNCDITGGYVHGRIHFLEMLNFCSLIK